MTHQSGYPRASAGRTSRSDEAVQRALFALNNQRPGEAQRIAGEVLKVDPRNGRALQILGCALLIQDRPQDAVAPLETAARALHDPEIDTQLAIALRRVGRNEDALARLRRAIKRRRPYPEAFHDLGSLLFALGRYGEAVEVLSRGLDVAPMMPQLCIQLGYAFLEMRNRTGAKAAFERALGISPGLPEALFGIAKAHQEIREHRAAADYFRRYLAAKSDHWGAWLSLGHCLLELGELEAGYECFRTAARGDPKHYGYALGSLVKSARGRFWLKPSKAAQSLLQTTR
jgi:tetratricopeptide (TPR) repeat protein